MEHVDAFVLACRIEAHWHKQGHMHVKAWAQVIPAADATGRNGAPCYGVRSNLVRGLPPPAPTLGAA